MLHRLRKVIPGVYRGSAPTEQDVHWLKEHLGIRKIISLDKESGDKIDNVCKVLGISHIIIPIDETKKSLINFLGYDIGKLLLEERPTYIHCKHGKDRTGLAVALFKCKYLGVSPEKAIKEAESIGLGVGLDAHCFNLYKKIIRNCIPKTDSNSADDAVSTIREYKSDNHDSYLDEAHQGSFSVLLDGQRIDPFDVIYPEINDQGLTRQNYVSENQRENGKEKDKISNPLVGLYNDCAGLVGAGPLTPSGGFISD